ncbi:MAG: hypothetical protein HWE25_15145 [Alphaproteobacteria bacterium]|nr:hypothetical protein [Alphaproteobacteria bacterium]
MGLLDFFKTLFAKPSQLTGLSAAAVKVEFDPTHLRTDFKGSETSELAWESISGIFVITNAGGPIAQDFFWCFASMSEQKILSFPGETEGVNHLLTELQRRYEDFDFKAFIDATGSTEEDAFLLWGVLPTADE